MTLKKSASFLLLQNKYASMVELIYHEQLVKGHSEQIRPEKKKQFKNTYIECL